MKNLSQYILPLIAGCYLLLQPQNAKAQNTYSYSTITYDAENNIVSSYGQTSPDYNSQVYYGSPQVQSKIVDANGNQLAMQSSNIGTLSIDVSGNGSSTYTVLTGHWILSLYRVYYSYSPCNSQYYYSAYNDYYNYQHFTETPSTPNAYGYYIFFGPGPQCYSYSSATILGQSTATVNVSLTPPVTFTMASIPGAQGNFQYVSGYQYVNLNATSSQCNPYTNITLTVNYNLPSNTQEVLGVTAKGFGSSSNANWYVSNVTHSDSLSSPPNGQSVLTINNKSGGQTDSTYNKIQITVKGKYQSGATYSSVGSVHLNCP